VAITPIQEGVNFYAALYDSAGMVIGQGYMYREENLLPGEVLAFDFQVATFYPIRSANFTVTAQSADYAIEGESNGVVIPEFQSFLILASFMAITLLAVLAIRRKGSESSRSINLPSSATVLVS
jgi:hypothetical protein